MIKKRRLKLGTQEKCDIIILVVEVIKSNFRVVLASRGGARLVLFYERVNFCLIKVENVSVWGFEHAVRGMRAPYMSYDKSDSVYREIYPHSDEADFVVGDNDLVLMQRLYKGGPEHRKFMRQIFVGMDVTAPFYWWKQFDKYQIGVTTDSESTMHTLTKAPLTAECFSVDGDFNIQDNPLDDPYFTGKDIACLVIEQCEWLRKLYLETKNPKVWRLLVQLLPEGYNQKRTVTLNYEVAANIIHQRAGHKLSEWQDFIDALRRLPYLQLIIGERIHE